jgi:hypothetical protein
MTFNLPAQLNDRLLAPIRRDLEEARGETVRAIASIETGSQIFTELVKPDLYAPKGIAASSKRSVVRRGSHVRSRQVQTWSARAAR